jgi:hypothetical protein
MYRLLQIPIFLFSLLFSCRNDTSNEAVSPLAKSPSGYTDTLRLDSAAIVYYRADSTQIASIREVTDSSVFNSMMHEYEYMLRGALQFISTAPETQNIPVTEARASRYLLFRMHKGDSLVDLDQCDVVGMFFFHPEKSPVSVDMANIAAQLPAYFGRTDQREHRP